MPFKFEILGRKKVIFVSPPNTEQRDLRVSSCQRSSLVAKKGHAAMHFGIQWAP